MLGSAMGNKAAIAYCSPWHCDQHGLCVVPTPTAVEESLISQENRFSSRPPILIVQQIANRLSVET